MFKGWMRFGGEEIANSQRVTAYAKHGLVPQGVEVEDCDGCDTLNLVNDEPGYESPLLDDAPWFDANNEATWDFAGLQILDATNMSGSTRTATFTELVGGGGVPGRARNATRVIAVSALLMGRTGESVEAGMEWLKAVLKGGGCAADDCLGDDLCVMTACPELCDQSTDPDTPLYTFEIDPTDPGWLAVDGSWIPSQHRFDPDGSEGMLGAPIQTPYDEFIAHWTVTSTGGPFTVAVGAVDADGNVLERGPDIPVGFTLDVDFTSTTMWAGDWRPVIWISDPGALVELTTEHRLYRTVDDCVTPYIRTYKGVVTVAGPTVTEEIAIDDCGGAKFLKVSWTWQVGNPHIFQPETELVRRMPTGGTVPEFQALGVEMLAFSPRPYSSCPDWDTVPLSGRCADPCCGGYDPPPSPPVIVDNCVPELGAWFWTRTAAQIPPRWVPVNTEGTLKLTIQNDHRAKVGVRIRVYPDPIGNGFDGLGQCDFCTEINIAYIPPNGTIVLDGSTETATVFCAGALVGEPATSVRGHEWATAFDWPTLLCGMGYLVAVDAPDIYREDCPPYYSAFGEQGGFHWSLSMIPRGD